MQNETAGTAFWEFGSAYKKLSDETDHPLIRQTKRIPAQRFLSQFLHFSCDIYIDGAMMSRQQGKCSVHRIFTVI